MKLPLPLLLLLTLLTSCSKDQERQLQLKTRCEHCAITWTVDGSPTTVDSRGENTYPIQAAEGDRVEVTMCRLATNRWLIDTIDFSPLIIDTVVSYDTVGSFTAWLYLGTNDIAEMGGYAEQDSCTSTSATVPE